MNFNAEDFINGFKDGLELMLHPKENVGKKMKSTKEALMTYAYFAGIPFLGYIVLALLLSPLGLSNLRGLGIISIFVIAAFVFFILTPILMYVGALFQHVIAHDIFKWFEKPFQNTFNATVLAAFPNILLSMFAQVSALGIIAQIASVVWGVIIYVLALSKQQDVPNGTAIKAMIAGALIMGFISAVLVLSFGSALMSLAGLATR